MPITAFPQQYEELFFTLLYRCWQCHLWPTINAEPWSYILATKWVSNIWHSNVLIHLWKLSPCARHSTDICEGTASALRSSLQTGQRNNCTEGRESATKGIVCRFSARAFLLLIIEDLKQLSVFILKALLFTFKRENPWLHSVGWHWLHKCFSKHNTWMPFLGLTEFSIYLHW